MRSLILFLATGAYFGRLPLAPGTWGSLWGVLFHCFLSRYSLFFYLPGLIALIFLAVIVAHQAEIITGQKDDSSIVIDEIAGMAVTLAQIPPTGWAVVVGFLLFRFFDITKIFPAKTLEGILPGGYGIVADDIVAGIYANLILRLILYITAA
ncbi:MAG: phosphatidylglycerophosphatase A [Thermodesulfobacteriota bacterium]|nr:phosphatidylglycerophosphatase A [Thermodesulfobacteriota bacterium]